MYSNDNAWHLFVDKTHSQVFYWNGAGPCGPCPSRPPPAFGLWKNVSQRIIFRSYINKRRQWIFFAISLGYLFHDFNLHLMAVCRGPSFHKYLGLSHLCPVKIITGRSGQLITKDMAQSCYWEELRGRHSPSLCLIVMWWAVANRNVSGVTVCHVWTKEIQKSLPTCQLLGETFEGLRVGRATI